MSASLCSGDAVANFQHIGVVMPIKVGRVHFERVLVDDSLDAVPVAVNVATHSPAAGELFAPGKNVRGAPNAHVVYNFAILLRECVAHASKSFKRLGLVPIIPSRRKARLILGVACAVVADMSRSRVAGDVLVLPIRWDVAVVIFQVVDAP